MALARKDLRKIAVNGHRYFWSARGTENGIALYVMTDTKNAQILMTEFSYGHEIIPRGNGRYSLTNQFVITPYTVRQVILQGLAEGWMPFDRGQPVYVTDIEHKIDLRLDLNKEDRIKESVKKEFSSRPAGKAGT